MNVAEFREWLATQDQEGIVYVLVGSQIIKDGVPVKFLFDPEKHSHYCSPGYFSYSTLLIGGE